MNGLLAVCVPGFAVAALLAGCAGEGPEALETDGNGGQVGSGTIDFATQVQPIFDRECSCHLSPSAPQGSVLLRGAAYDSLVNVASTESPSFLRVKPGLPDESYLVIKIDDAIPGVRALRVGDRMPTARPLAAAEVRTIRQWIAEGALRAAPRRDTEPPSFEGIAQAVAVSTSEIDVSWSLATDNQTPPQDIVYKVFLATAPGAQDFSRPELLAAPRSTTVRVDGLEPGTLYYFVVRSEDAAGNQDQNRAELSVKTLEPEAPPAFTRGDADRDRTILLADVVFLLDFLFRGGAAPLCTGLGDADADRLLSLSDAVFLLGHLFLGGGAPAPLDAGELSACEAADGAAIARGREVYGTPDPRGTPFACATCHAVVPDSESEFLLAAHSLQDALRRPSYKLGQVESFLDATNLCRVHWMDAIPWGEGSPSFTDLVAFLESVSPRDPAPALVYEIVATTASGPATGDPQAGCELYHRSCVVCHGPGAAGSDLGPPLNSFPLESDYVRLKIRRSGPAGTVYGDLIGGYMPFWPRDKLSDAEVEDLAAYLATEPLPACSTGGAGP